MVPGIVSRRASPVTLVAVLTGASVLIGYLATHSPSLLLGVGGLVGVGVVTWRWPQVVPAALLVGPGFIHLLTSSVALGATRGDVLASPITFLPVLLALFGPPAFKGLTDPSPWKWSAIAPRTAGRILITGMSILSVLLLIRFPGTSAPTYGLTKIVGFAVYSVFPVALVFVAFRNARDAERILDALLVIGAAWLGLSLLIAASHGNLDLYRADPGELLGGSSQAGGGLGSRAAYVAIVSIASVLGTSRRSVLRIGLGMVAIIVLLLSGHRGSILAFVVGMVVLLALTYRNVTLGRAIAGAIAIAVLAGAGWWAFQHAPTEIRQRYNDPLSSQSVNDRLALQRAALAGWFVSPIYGQGTGASAFLTTASDQSGFGVVNGIYPHNVLVELLAELGLIGAGAYVVAIGGTFIRALRARKRTQLVPGWPVIAAASCTAASFAYSQVSADLTIQNDLWIIASVLALSAIPVLSPDSARPSVVARASDA
jgi:O-antigen ligase